VDRAAQILPDFIIRDDLAEGRLETVLPDWSLPAGALHWVTPLGGPRPARVEALARFFAGRLSSRKG
jgi:DNA-binding transcriptional LysR family regulator